QPMPRWMVVAAKFVQFTLYALLIAIPATAVLGTWLEGLPVTILGSDIALRVAQAPGLGQLIMEIHTALGNVSISGAGGHASSASFHHSHLRDDAFRSMTARG